MSHRVKSIRQTQGEPSVDSGQQSNLISQINRRYLSGDDSKLGREGGLEKEVVLQFRGDFQDFRGHRRLSWDDWLRIDEESRASVS